MLFSLEQIKEHLRYDIDDTSNDLILTSYLMASEQAVKKYIRPDIDLTQYEDIKVAVMLLVGFFDLYRNAEVQTNFNHTYLPYPILMLLAPYRTPTVI